MTIYLIDIILYSLISIVVYIIIDCCTYCEYKYVEGRYSGEKFEDKFCFSKGEKQSKRRVSMKSLFISGILKKFCSLTQ